MHRFKEDFILRTKTKTRKMNEQRIKQLNMQKGNQKSKKNIRKRAKAYDLEKAAIVAKNKIFYSFFAEDKRFSKIKVNECKYRKYEQDNNILVQMKEVGHIPILNYFLGEELSSKSEYIVIDVKQIDTFMEYLKSIEGKNRYCTHLRCYSNDYSPF